MNYKKYKKKNGPVRNHVTTSVNLKPEQKETLERAQISLSPLVRDLLDDWIGVNLDDTIEFTVSSHLISGLVYGTDDANCSLSDFDKSLIANFLRQFDDPIIQVDDGDSFFSDCDISGEKSNCVNVQVSEKKNTAA